MKNYYKSLKSIQDFISTFNGTAGEFSEYLIQNRIAHLSFSRISALNFCPYRYYLSYQECVILEPRPEYFEKGSIFHEAADTIYQGLKEGKRPNSTQLANFVSSRTTGENRQHLLNAVHVLQQNLWDGWEIIGIEVPFVMDIGEELPPCVGVIDLILRKDNSFTIVDHKTGRNFWQSDFYDPSKLQMSIYREYINRTFSPGKISSYYDKYRWINNLQTIRKPAFEREELVLEEDSWNRTHHEIAANYQRMRKHYIKKHYPKNGKCYMCPYRDYCK